MCEIILSIVICINPLLHMCAKSYIRSVTQFYISIITSNYFRSQIKVSTIK